jgi:hypothetical protein
VTEFFFSSLDLTPEVAEELQEQVGLREVVGLPEAMDLRERVEAAVQDSPTVADLRAVCAVAQMVEACGAVKGETQRKWLWRLR